MNTPKIDKSSFFLTLIFVVATSLIFFLMGLAYKHLQRQSDNLGCMTHSYDVSMQLEKLYSDLKDIETERRNFILTKDKNSKQFIEQSASKIDKKLATLQNLLKNNPEQLKNLNLLTKMVNYKYKLIKESFRQVSEEQSDEVTKKSLLLSNKVMASIHNKIENMLATEKVILEKRRSEYLFTQNSTPVYLYIISIFSLGLLSFAFYKINKDNKRQTQTNKELTFHLESSKEAEKIGNYGFWEWKKDENKFWFSDNLFRIFGLDPYTNEPRLEILLKTIHPDDMPLVETKVRKMYSGEFMKSFSHRIYRANDGALRYLSVNNRLIKDPVVGTYIVFFTKDVTNETLDKQNLEEQNLILEANNKELQAFNYAASHDLQEPLRKIETFISRLFDLEYQNLSESGKQYLNKTKTSAGRMRKLIDDLLQFSRSTRTDKVFEIADLNNILEEAKEELQQKIEEKKAVINAEKLPVLQVVPFQIKQLFVNFLSNSLKYSKAEISPQINITLEEIKAQQEPILTKENSDKIFYKISFTDNGIGFDAQYTDKVFQLFHRLHARTEYEGTGIGLAICKKIVESHKGYITADSQPGEGAVFTVYLPKNI